MSHRLLLPHQYKKVGWLILIPATIMGVASFLYFDEMQVKAKVFAIFYGGILEESHSFSFVKTNITNTVVGILFIVGALMVSFSKEDTEDEFIANLRQSSLLWAVLVNYILLIFSFAFIYGTAFLNVMIYNMFTVLIIFILRFNYILYRNSKAVSDEKYN